MKTKWFLLFLVSTSALAQQNGLTPDSFNYQTGITLGDGGPFQEVTLPYNVYAGVQRNNVNDLRVFNGLQEVIPYALYKKQPSSVVKQQETILPVFPIITSAEQTNNGLQLDIKRNSQGQIKSLRQTGIKSDQKNITRGAVFDTSNIKDNYQTLNLKTATSNIPFHSFKLESSNDLQHWNLVSANNQLVQLRHDGRLIEKNTTDLRNRGGKYLRLLWNSPERAPQILSASVSATKTSTAYTKSIWSAAITPTVITENIYEYALSRFIPIEQLRFNLAQTNSLSPVTLQYFIEGTSKRYPDRWQDLQAATIYRLRTPQGDITSDDIKIRRHPGDRLRLLVDSRSGGIGNTPPTLEISFTPHNLVFLPRGEGPYTLAWGNLSAKNASLPISTLIPGFKLDNKLSIANAQLLTIDNNLLPTAPTKVTSENYSNALLWGILIAGVLALAAMAWKLVSQISKTDQDS